MSKFLRWLSVFICAVAAAGAVQTSYAASIPEPEITVSPEPAVTVSPEPEATASPEPVFTESPEPEATASPEPSAAASPEPSATVFPEPAALASPEPAVTVSPEPEVIVSPASGDDSSSADILAVLQDIRTLLDVQPYAYYDAYYGSISSTYLEYMRGYLSKLPPDVHYVGARTGQYDYIFAFGADLTYNGSSFAGAVTVIRWNTYNNGTMYQTYDSSFYLNPGSYLVYSDLSDKYPSLATSSDVSLRQILIVFTVFCLCLTIDHMYQVRRIRRVSKGGR